MAKNTFRPIALTSGVAGFADPTLESRGFRSGREAVRKEREAEEERRMRALRREQEAEDLKLRPQERDLKRQKMEMEQEAIITKKEFNETMKPLRASHTQLLRALAAGSPESMGKVIESMNKLDPGARIQRIERVQGRDGVLKIISIDDDTGEPTTKFMRVYKDDPLKTVMSAAGDLKQLQQSAEELDSEKYNLTKRLKEAQIEREKALTEKARAETGQMQSGKSPKAQKALQTRIDKLKKTINDKEVKAAGTADKVSKSQKEILNRQIEEHKKELSNLQAQLRGPAPAPRPVSAPEQERLPIGVASPEQLERQGAVEEPRPYGPELPPDYIERELRRKEEEGAGVSISPDAGIREVRRAQRAQARRALAEADPFEGITGAARSVKEAYSRWDLSKKVQNFSKQTLMHNAFRAPAVATFLSQLPGQPGQFGELRSGDINTTGTLSNIISNHIQEKEKLAKGANKDSLGTIVQMGDVLTGLLAKNARREPLTDERTGPLVRALANDLASNAKGRAGARTMTDFEQFLARKLIEQYNKEEQEKLLAETELPLTDVDKSLRMEAAGRQTMQRSLNRGE